MRRFLFLSCVLSLSASIGCATDEVGEASDLIVAGSPDEVAVLALVNDRDVTQSMFDIDVGLDRRAAANIVSTRNGPDWMQATADDVDFQSIVELDAVSYVGPRALADLLAYARANGYLPVDAPVDVREATMLAFVNDGATSFELLDDDVGLDRRAAGNIIAHRAGDDGLLETADDRAFATVNELDAISYVGERALELIYEYALAHGFGPSQGDVVAEVIFSPQPFATSHATRVLELIDGAQSSLDIAMYSFSIGSIYDAIEAAVARGVKVRMIFETANADRRASDPSSTRSARLERMGVNVRYVNKIMHHKFILVDGPRDDDARAMTASIASGSANWSNGGATRYDENTLFLRGLPEFARSFQREFDHLWSHSRDFVFDESLPYELATNVIDEVAMPDDAAALFTSDNFTVTTTTFRVTGANTVSDALVAAIDAATDSIHVASGHLRSRPVSEAIMRAARERPEMDIRVYLDGQEWISEWVANAQANDLEDCVEVASTESQIRRCYDRGFKFGYDVQEAGADVRYKFYSYRWHYTYAVQMHHKYLVIDGDELWTGSYNLSDNAEHNTMENMLMFRGPRFAELVAAYEANFESMWETHRDDGTYESIEDDIRTDPLVPLVFTPVAMTWSQVDDIRRLTRTECPAVDSADYRSRPENYRVCER